MNNLFVGISDVHICLKNLEVSIEVLRQSLERAKEFNVPLVIAGDLNDTKAVMRSEWVGKLIELFKSFSDVRIIIIDGNHDLNNRADSRSSLSFLSLIGNCEVYHKPTEIDFKGITFGLVPYQKDKGEFLSICNQMKDKSIKNLICHQGFMGAFMGDYVVDDSSVDPEELTYFDKIYSGHYHKHQLVGENIMYFGSPFTVNFGESNQEKFYWVISEVKGEIHRQPYLTQVRKHVQFELQPGYSVEDFPKHNDIDLIKIVLKGPKEFALGTHDFSAIKSKNITLVPKIDAQSEERIDHSIVNKPIEVINSYLESAETSFNKEELKEYLFNIVGDIFNNRSSKLSKDNKVQSVVAKNFLSYESIEYGYDSKGLTLIEGHDEDLDISTGAGKSSFLDVVCYGLFGKTSKDLKADEVINRTHKKNLSIILRLNTNAGPLIVERYRKHSKHENDLLFYYEGQKDPSRGKDNRETQKLLEEELGLDFDMFLRSSYFTQFGNIDKFLSASDTEKKKVISEICDTQIYDEILVILKETIKDLAIKNTELEKNLFQKNSEVGGITSNLESLRTKSIDWEKGIQDKIESEEQMLKSFKANLLKSIEQCIIDRDNYEKEREETIQNLKESQSQAFNSFNKEIEDKKALIETKKKSLLDVESKIVSFDKPDFEDEKKSIADKKKIIESLRLEANKLNAEADSKNRDISKLEDKINKANSKTEESNCLSCFQPISEQHIEKHVKELNLLISNHKREIESILVKESDIIRAIKDSSGLDERLKEISHEEISYNSNVANSKSFSDLASNICKEIEDLSNYIGTAECRDQYSSLIEKTKITVNPFIEKEEELKVMENPIQSKIDSLRLETNLYQDLIKEEEAKLKESSSQLENLAHQESILSKLGDYTSWWKDAFHIYIKSYLTDSFINQINEIANDRLNQMFDGILSIKISATKQDKKSTKEKITVVIYNKNQECSYQSLSGGERCRICFALNLAISQVTNMNFGFLMFDEVLNGLDDVGKSQVMRVLKELESQYSTIFVIDHATEFKSLFTNSIMVMKSNDISRVVE